MFIVSWTIKTPSRVPLYDSFLTDHYSAHESYEEAREALDKLIAETDLAGNGPDRYGDLGSIKEKHPQETPTGPFLYSATMSAVIASTDYDALHMSITAHPQDGSIVDGELYNDDECEPLDLGAFFGVKFEKHKPTRPTNSKEIP